MSNNYSKYDPRNQDPKGDFAYRARLEAEIDALKAELGSYTAKLVKANGLIDNWKERCDMLDMEVREFKAENERLNRELILERETNHVELDGKEQEISDLIEENERLISANLRLQEECELLRADAERYHFQESHNFRFFPYPIEQWEVLGFKGDVLARGSAETYESAIDAAMKDFSTHQKEEECDK